IQIVRGELNIGDETLRSSDQESRRCSSQPWCLLCLSTSRSPTSRRLSTISSRTVPILLSTSRNFLVKKDSLLSRSIPVTRGKVERSLSGANRWVLVFTAAARDGGI